MSDTKSIPLASIDRKVMAGGGVGIVGLVLWLAMQVHSLSADVAAQAATLDAMRDQLARIEARLDR